MGLKQYDRVESQQFDQLVALNERCLELLETESYENLLSLFEERDILTKAFIQNSINRQHTDMFELLNRFDSVIMTKIIEKKTDCSENLSAFYRHYNAKKEYIETHRSLLNST